MSDSVTAGAGHEVSPSSADLLAAVLFASDDAADRERWRMQTAGVPEWTRQVAWEIRVPVAGKLGHESGQALRYFVVWTDGEYRVYAPSPLSKNRPPPNVGTAIFTYPSTRPPTGRIQKAAKTAIDQFLHSDVLRTPDPRAAYRPK